MGPLVPRPRNKQLSHPFYLRLRLYTVTIYGKNDNIDEDDDSKDSERTGLLTHKFPKENGDAIGQVVSLHVHWSSNRS